MHATPPRVSGKHVVLERLPSNFVESHMDVDYFIWKFGEEIQHFAYDEDRIVMHCLVLPRTNMQHVFCLVTEEWQ
jgi:hypothetical protein